MRTLIILVSATREELGDLPGEPLGVGPVAVAARLARLVADRRPDAVVLIGTAGAYPGGPPIGSAVVARRVGHGEGVAAMGLGYVPHPPVPIVCDPRLVSRLVLPEVDVLSTGAVTTDPVLAARLSDGWQVEHLEAFAAAAACADAGVPFTAVLGIVHEVGPDAHTQWLTNRNRAREVAREAVGALVGGAIDG